MADNRRRHNAQARSLEDRLVERALRFWTAREILAIAREALSLLNIVILLAFAVLTAARYV